MALPFASSCGCVIRTGQRQVRRLMYARNYAAIQVEFFPIAAKMQRFHGKFALDHSDRQDLRLQVDGSESGPRRKEDGEGFRSPFRAEPERSGYRRIAEAAQRIEQRVARHGPRIVVSALVLVIGVANVA